MINSSPEDPLLRLPPTSRLCRPRAPCLQSVAPVSEGLVQAVLRVLLLVLDLIARRILGHVPRQSPSQSELFAHMSCDCCIDSWCVVGYHDV